MATRKNSKPVRLDPALLDDFQSVKAKRMLQLKDDGNKLTPAELSRMMRNCPSYPQLKNELSSLPRRKKR